MLKFIKHHLETITGIEFFPLISFVIFFVFFVICLIWVLRADKQKMDEIARLPLDQNESQP